MDRLKESLLPFEPFSVPICWRELVLKVLAMLRKRGEKKGENDGHS